jgi:hypothetical protein
MMEVRGRSAQTVSSRWAEWIGTRTSSVVQLDITVFTAGPKQLSVALAELSPEDARDLAHALLLLAGEA